MNGMFRHVEQVIEAGALRKRVDCEQIHLRGFPATKVIVSVCLNEAVLLSYYQQSIYPRVS